MDGYIYPIGVGKPDPNAYDAGDCCTALVWNADRRTWEYYPRDAHGSTLPIRSDAYRHMDGYTGVAHSDGPRYYSSGDGYAGCISAVRDAGCRSDGYPQPAPDERAACGGDGRLVL